MIIYYEISSNEITAKLVILLLVCISYQSSSFRHNLLSHLLIHYSDSQSSQLLVLSIKSNVQIL